MESGADAIESMVAAVRRAEQDRARYAAPEGGRVHLAVAGPTASKALFGGGASPSTAVGGSG